MQMELNSLCFYAKERVAVAGLSAGDYISTENMLPHRGGVAAAESLPPAGQTQGFRKGDVLVSNIRPYFKKIWLADRDGGCSGDVLVFRAKDTCDSRFLYCVLADDRFFRYAAATARGTKMPRGDKAAIMRYGVPDIRMETQRRIADILGALERRIEVNRSVSGNLQRQAQAVYAEVFGDCGMNSGVLGELAEITMGQAPKGSSYNENGVGEVFYQGRAEFGFRFPQRRLFTTEPKRMAQKGDVLLSVRAPVGDLNVACERCCIGRGLSALRSKRGQSSFLLYTMLAVKPQLDVFNGEGTVFGCVGRETLNSLPVPVPEASDIAKFERIVRPMDDLILAKHQEICGLCAVRDTLLPRLLSGEIDLSR